ncbi:hypothetical protein DFJ67_7183 [Asanoa ferruginea]|uniref:Uncharacterized protein n=1 Tax=Asanoa ferruginea TaxID=53367 RepID=A0A3D9ZV95_9ACTN|nr:hypothetical protein [Asanoa ferruginea]REG01108.1 hypothetical protein DFJ67_7183 [Asanoa ferruginea]GIF47192.1 hypothetical protein Afe04nite_17310 [Asanoa ferruginea]
MLDLRTLRLLAAAVAASLLLAGCYMGDPTADPAGVVSVDGQVAAVVPQCGDEYVAGLTIEEYPYEEDVSVQPTSRVLWSVSGARKQRSTGPFVIGDAGPWKSEAVPLTGPLPAMFMLSITTSRRTAVSGIEQSMAQGLKHDQVLVDGATLPSSALAEKWGC